MSESVAPPPLPETKPPGNPLRAVLNFFTSLKLAVVILGLSALLVFLGTIAQVQEGLGQAQARWFKQWIVLRQPGDPVWVWFFPGGYLLGTLLLINLMGGHLRRFKFPPGGWPVLLLHYVVVMAALFIITYWLLWNPWIFFMACMLLLVGDLLISDNSIGWKPLVGTGRKIGVDLTHVGIVVLMVGQLATDMLAVETHMSLKEGESRRYSENWTGTEIVLARDIPGDSKNEEVVAIPDGLLVKNEKATGESVPHDKLPFKVKVLKWMPNSDLIDLAEASQHEATLRQALATVEATYSSTDQLVDNAHKAEGMPSRVKVWTEAFEEVGEPLNGRTLASAAEMIKNDPVKAPALLTKLKSGFRGMMFEAFKNQQDPNARYAATRVESDQPITETSPERQASTSVALQYYALEQKVRRDMEARNIPSAVVELIGTGGSLGTWLLSPHLKGQTVKVDGKEWRLSLRIERQYYPFTVHLLKTQHLVYAGTNEPRDFRSRVRLVHPDKNEDRETEIFMNAPLRYEGLTFFQHQMGRDEVNQNRGTSSLQVVKNPSWFSPYFGCALVGYGMLRHFLLHLFRFNRKRSAS